jgi:N-carbamoyl-L-amino-acid hydrolase
MHGCGVNNRGGVGQPELGLSVRLNADRLWSTIERSAEIGRSEGGGLSRLALTDSDKEMRDQFQDWCRQAYLETTVDQVGNMFARRQGRENDLPPVLFGSHLDTQEKGGRFDGILGVLAGLEVMRSLNDAGHVTRRPLVLVNWTNEEGSRFSPLMLASGCFAGAYTVDWAHGRISDDGSTFGDELRRIGYLGQTPVGGAELDAYFELHIEQGPILDSENIPVGIVTHAYHSDRIVVEFDGEAAHALTWPIEKRRNALVAGARLVASIDDIAWEYAPIGGMASAGQLLAKQNKPGVVSSWARVVCSVSHADEEVERTMLERARAAIADAAGRSRCDARIVDTWRWGGSIFDRELISTARTCANALGYPNREMPSQAAHDAYFLARVCPAAMIFSPCRSGLSHNEAESTTKAVSIPAANVLLHSVVARADRT